MPDEASTYAIPRGGARSGASGATDSTGLPSRRSPADRGRRLVVCHLGGGCSVTAVLDGRSVDTTMGFSPLEGVPMATRSGSVDPGALVYVLRERGLRRRARPRARARVRARRARGLDDRSASPSSRTASPRPRRDGGGARRARGPRVLGRRGREPRRTSAKRSSHVCASWAISRSRSSRRERT